MMTAERRVTESRVELVENGGGPDESGSEGLLPLC